MRHQSLTRFALVPLLLALTTACAGSRGTQAGGARDGEGGGAPGTDTGVQEQLAQFVTRVGRVDGVQVVALELENRGDSRLDFAWGVEWYDRAGEAVLDLEAGWTTARLGAGERLAIELVAPTPAADSWKLVAVSAP